MNASVYSITGTKGKEIKLPKSFASKVDFELIKRSFVTMQSNLIQRNGPSRRSGRENTARYVGRRSSRDKIINTEHARLPRMRNRRSILAGTVAGVSHAVGGPRAHRLTPDKITEEKMNRKENRKAIDSAIAATTKIELIKQKHLINENLSLPLIVEAKFEELTKTTEVKKVLEALNVYMDIENSKDKRKIRAGKGKMRGRKYKHKKSLLIVAEKTDNIFRAARNLEGVEVVKAKDLNAMLLAPGGVPGRLTLWTENAINSM
ncbi:MAG: 50S ribosomal protein L4 [Candidatus Diapherotrites archaeon]|nr:50S ribosomal protein L4 [Candidatus Diapherotrites archaeon]